METGIRESRFILIVCTPSYERKSNERVGGVGYEGTIMTAEVAAHANDRKFIPVLRIGEWADASPTWVKGKKYIDLRGDPYSQENYHEVLQTLHGLLAGPPALGSVPDKSTFASRAASPPSGTTIPSTPKGTTLDQLPLRDQILTKLYDLWSKNPKDSVGSERFRNMGDEDDIHEAILELAADGLISHSDPIRTGVPQTIRRIPLIKINGRGKASAQAIKQSLLG